MLFALSLAMMGAIGRDDPRRTASKPVPTEDWAAALRGGDTHRFRELVEHFQPTVGAFCLRYLGDVSVAADITQDTFTTLWRERRRYEDRGKLRAYLLSIARHRCMAHIKSRRRLTSLVRDDRRSPDTQDQNLLAQQLRRSIASLRPAFAEVVVLRYLEELDLKEIAELTGQPLGTVKSRLHRALLELRKVWGDEQ